MIFIVSPVSARGKLILQGRIVDSDGNKVKNAIVTLLSDGQVVSEQETGSDGKYKFKKLKEGEYVLQATNDEMGSAEINIALAGNRNIGDVSLSKRNDYDFSNTFETERQNIGDISSVNRNGFSKSPFNVSGTVTDANGNGLKKVDITVSGRVVNSKGYKVKKASVLLTSEAGKVRSIRTSNSGKFRFKKIKEGMHVLSATHDAMGSAAMIVNMNEQNYLDLGDITLGTKLSNHGNEDSYFYNDPRHDNHKKIITASVIKQDTRKIIGSVVLSKGDGTIIREEKFWGDIILTGISEGYYRFKISTEESQVYETVINLNKDIHLKLIL
tara:strand:+ start:1482 stop:2462 length:981 start_codon:yes stop_codon:yes gene_type:complete